MRASCDKYVKSERPNLKERITYLNRNYLPKWEHFKLIYKPRLKARSRAKVEFYGPKGEEIRRQIMERDNYTCQLCGGPGEHVHHKIQLQDGGTNRPDNLITLCHECHKAIHPWMGMPKKRSVVMEIDTKIMDAVRALCE